MNVIGWRNAYRIHIAPVFHRPRESSNDLCVTVASSTLALEFLLEAVQ